jgi:phosphoribosylanthranilate isomerase
VRDDLLIKICGITNEPDALLAVGLGADALGFVLAPSPRQVGAALAADIVKRLPHGVLTVGVFRDEAPSRVVEIANTVGFGAVQLHGHETVEQCLWIRERVACTIRAFPAGDRAIPRFPEFGADYLLVDGQSPGSGQVFDWRLAEGVVDPGRMFVSGGLTADNVGDAIVALRPRGVDVSSGVEAAPGTKDPHKLRSFVRNARAAAGAVGAARSARAAGVAGAAGAGGVNGEPGKRARVARTGETGTDVRSGADAQSADFDGLDGTPEDEVPYDWMDG